MKSEAMLSQRSRLVEAANRTLPIFWKARFLKSPELEAQAICDRVQREAGLDDFGDDWFRQPLSVLIKALDEEAELNPFGRLAAVVQFRKVLKDRLYAQHWFSAHPKIEKRSLKSPVIVVGPMRSGTTRLHRLLAADERFAHMRFFETVCPVPPPSFRSRGPDRRWLTAAFALGTVHRLNPNMGAIHPTAPLEPEEELGLLVSSIWGMKHEAQWHVPSYGRWSEQQDATPAYEHMARLLRLIGWARGDDDTRPWVLKTPQHMLDLPALLRVFPDARIIFTHREPQAVVGSSCSLVWNQMIIHSNRVDALKIGQEWMRKTELQIARMRKARMQIPESQRIDVRFEDMERDWKGVMQRIYRFLDMDMEPALPGMSSYISDAETKRRRRPHRYSLSAFGLDGADVSAQFRSYTAAFDLGSSASEPHSDKPIVFPEPVKHRNVANVGGVSEVRDWEPASAAPATAAAGGQS